MYCDFLHAALAVLKAKGIRLQALAAHARSSKLRDSGLQIEDLCQLIPDGLILPSKLLTDSTSKPKSTAPSRSDACSSTQLRSAAASTADQPSWLQPSVGSDIPHDPYVGFLALAWARRKLVSSNVPPGVKGFLQHPRVLSALQGILPHLPLIPWLAEQQPQQQQDRILQTAAACRSTASSSSSTGTDGGEAEMEVPSLLQLLPPAQRAWLLAELTAGLLFANEQGPNSR